MKHISIFCVNYNSYEELSNYLFSLEQAAIFIDGKACVDVFVADNTDKDFKDITGIEYEHINVSVYSFHQNLGYFGAINRMMKTVDITKYDYFVISNVDLVVDKSFFQVLCQLQVRNDIGWIAPQIYSKEESRDRNPKIQERYSLRKLEILRLFYKYPIINRIYTLTAYRRKKYQQYSTSMTIYGGHGSFIILTKQYIESCGIIDYPVFLFGEELYLAEKCRKSKLKVVYEPSLKVVDSEHTSTGKLKGCFYNKCNLESLDYIIRTYY